MLNEKELLKQVELLAHKLKNPGHTMGLNLEVLRAKIGKMGATDLLNLVDIIHRELQRQNQILQRHVEYLTPAGGSRKKIQIKSLFALLKAEVLPVAQERQIYLEFAEADALVQGNLTELFAALRELTLNAIEASNPGGTVWIRVATQNREVVLEIEDQGAGIDQNELGKITELYYSEKKGHLGTGLPLAKKYIEENGGKIRIHSAVKKGTTVLISFEKC